MRASLSSACLSRMPHRNFYHFTRLYPFERVANVIYDQPDNGPPVGPQYNYGNAPVAKVLLVSQALVSCQQEFIPIAFSVV